MTRHLGLWTREMCEFQGICRGPGAEKRRDRRESTKDDAKGVWSASTSGLAPS